MDTFNKITISNFIWYLVPGLGFIFYILFPIIVFKPLAVEAFIKSAGPIVIIILGCILGLFLDGLRLYRFRPGYSRIKKDFFEKLLNTIEGINDPYIIQYLIYDIARKKEVTELGMHHAIWIMLGHFTVLAFFESIYWFIMVIYFCSKDISYYTIFGANSSKEIVIFTCVSFGLLFFIVCLRLLYISMEDQNNTNNMFSEFAKTHKSEILERFNIPI